MEPIEILQEFNSCYAKIQAIAQNENWLLLIANKKALRINIHYYRVYENREKFA
ncbi:hypothetical protein [Nostoc sp.]|uniref:hypothetical protein n=1 Tax=Nostoc sp. TaxID=1180 RepID=UPI002FF7CB08